MASSPEILCRVDQDKLVTNRPLAGTRKRGATPEEDKALEENLLADEKELAEHTMLVDLGRNDVGKVCTLFIYSFLAAALMLLFFQHHHLPIF